MSKGSLVGLGCLGVVLLVALVLGLSGVGQYNTLVTLSQAVDAQWSQVENVYQRRADLIPNLVAAVKGAAEFERGTLEAGYGRQVSETPRGHARRAGRELDLEPEALAVLEGEYEAVRFGDQPVGSSDAEAAESAWARLRGRLGL